MEIPQLMGAMVVLAEVAGLDQVEVRGVRLLLRHKEAMVVLEEPQVGRVEVVAQGR